MDSNYNYIAVDVSKETLQLQTPEGKSLCLPYDKTGLKKIVGEVSENTIVVFETTGGYERVVRKYLESKNILWTMVHPARVRAYAKALLLVPILRRAMQ